MTVSAPFRGPRRWIRAHPQGADIALAMFIATTGVLAHVFGHAHEEVADPSIGGVLLTLAGTLPLIWRRSHPAIVLVAVAIPQFGL